VPRAEQEIVAFDFEYRDALLTLACPACDGRHTERLPSLMMVSRPVCPACGHAERLEPAAVAAAAARLLPALDLAAGWAVDARLAALVRGWRELPEIAELLDYGGVELGAGASLDLVPLLLHRLLLASR
jgi:hypothetical protein